MFNLLTLDRHYVPLTRQVEVIAIPAGESLQLDAGTEVKVVQELGGDLTVRGRRGDMFRVRGEDADALGLSVKRRNGAQKGSSAQLTEALLWQQLETCFDPEIPVNIVDLGLVYECRLEPVPSNNGHAAGHRASVKMTLTAPGCGMGQVLADDVKRKLESLPGVVEAEVEVVFDPPWNPGMMSEAARLATGLM